LIYLNREQTSTRNVKLPAMKASKKANLNITSKKPSGKVNRKEIEKVLELRGKVYRDDDLTEMRGRTNKALPPKTPALKAVKPRSVKAVRKFRGIPIPGIVYFHSVNGERARIEGSGIEVWEIIAEYNSLRKTFKRLQWAFHWLTEQQLKAALRYYLSHREEIDKLIAENELSMKKLLNYKGIYGSAYFSAADAVFHGKLVNIGDLVTFEGKGIEGLKKAFMEAVKDYLAICKKTGKEPFTRHADTILAQGPKAWDEMGRNPLGEAINVPAKKVVKSRIKKAVKDAMPGKK
jgi:uncharacterized protein (DUF433 family)